MVDVEGAESKVNMPRLTSRVSIWSPRRELKITCSEVESKISPRRLLPTGTSSSTFCSSSWWPLFLTLTMPCHLARSFCSTSWSRGMREKCYCFKDLACAESTIRLIVAWLAGTRSRQLVVNAVLKLEPNYLLEWWSYSPAHHALSTKMYIKPIRERHLLFSIRRPVGVYIIWSQPPVYASWHQLTIV